MITVFDMDDRARLKERFYGESRSILARLSCRRGGAVLRPCRPRPRPLPDRPPDPLQAIERESHVRSEDPL